MGSGLFHEPLQIELLGGYTDPCLVRILKVLGVRDMHLELLGIVVDPAPGGPPVRPPQPERTCVDEELAPRVPPVLSLRRQLLPRLYSSCRPWTRTEIGSSPRARSDS